MKGVQVKYCYNRWQGIVMDPISGHQVHYYAENFEDLIRQISEKENASIQVQLWLGPQ